MGLFKSVKKLASSKLGTLALTAAATAGGGLVGGLAASTLLGAVGGKAKGPSPTDVPVSPLAGLPEFTGDVTTRPQVPGQTAEGGGIASSDLLSVDTEDEKKRRAARTLLG